MSETILLIVDDLLFLPRLEDRLRKSGYLPRGVAHETELIRALGSAPVLIIIDLFSRTFQWERFIHLIKGPGKKGDHIPVLGFGPHTDLKLREQALAAGCEAVVGRGAITNQLPQLIEKHKWQLDKRWCQQSPPSLITEGLELFNQGEYYDCHELIEEAWMAEKRAVRLMYQGILQIGVACYHIQNKNWRGAMKMLERGLPKVQPFAPHCMGINLDKFLSDTEAIRQELLRLGPKWQGEFNQLFLPTIEFAKVT